MQWVAQEVLVHEPSLRSWLRRAVGPDDVEDIIQESYCRISNLREISHIKNGRAYFFTTAKMIILERIRRSRVVSIETVAELDKLQVYDETGTPEEIIVTKNYLNSVKLLIEDLPERCRKVFKMRKIEGLSQREVATQLGLAEHTVENDVAKGLNLILKAIADGEREAETSLESMDKHGRPWLSTGNQ
jgi:RNA polymerase sigma-70 factor (ECF subfamily)